jgi:hypothetical protein
MDKVDVQELMKEYVELRDEVSNAPQEMNRLGEKYEEILQSGTNEDNVIDATSTSEAINLFNSMVAFKEEIGEKVNRFKGVEGRLKDILSILGESLGENIKISGYVKEKSGPGTYNERLATMWLEDGILRYE